MLRLLVHIEDSEPYFYDCNTKSLVLGRGSSAELALSDPFVSRQHARLFLNKEGWHLETLGRNPTMVNGQNVDGPTRVNPGDTIQLSAVKILIDTEVDATAATMRLGVSGRAFLKSASKLMDDQGGGEKAKDGLGATLKRQTERLRLLNEIHRALAGPISLQDLLELILDRAFVHLKPEEGAIYLKRPDGEFYMAASRRAPGVTGEFFYSRSLIQEVTEKGLAAFVLDTSEDERFSTSESIIFAGVKSILAAPLLDTEGCPGVIVLHSRSFDSNFAEDDMELLVSMASAAALRIRNIALAEEVAQRRLLEKELEVAHDIQMGLLPTELPARPECELAASLRPAKSVGGDLYDFFVDEDRLWFLAGDVSGKGVGPALFMAVTRTLFRGGLQADTPLAEIIDRVNNELCRGNRGMLFVTVFVGCLDLKTGEILYGNAGHDPPYHLRADGAVEEVTGEHGVPLGVMEDYEYETCRMQLAPGEALYLYTDGVTEALNAAEEQFTNDRLESYLGGVSRDPAAAVVEGTLAAVDAFVGDAPQFDDITVMLVRFLGPPTAPDAPDAPDAPPA